MSDNHYKLTDIQKRELVRRGCITIESSQSLWSNLLSAFGDIFLYTTIFSCGACIVYMLVLLFAFRIFGPDGISWLDPKNSTFFFIAIPIISLTFILPIFNALGRAMSFGSFFVSEKRGIMDHTSIIAAEGRGFFSGASFIEKFVTGLRENNPDLFLFFLTIGIIQFAAFPLEFLLVFSLFMSIATFGRPIFLFFHPLYAFSTLGHKIEDLAKEIAIQSRSLQENIKMQGGYEGLSGSFDALSRSFSQIIQQILKLEKCERKIQGGDIFDAKKYISSLREDIRSPLISLRSFFEIQKSELIRAQSEMMRVHVGSNGLSGQEMLTSDRSMMILKEIDTAIVKLDAMIGKMI